MNENEEEPTKPEINIPVKTEVVRLPCGLVVRRTTYQTGNVSDTIVFPGDHSDARAVKA